MITLTPTMDRERETYKGVGDVKQTSILEGTVTSLPCTEMFMDS